jgi:isopenicillin N synthase-like dioxygenase
MIENNVPEVKPSDVPILKLDEYVSGNGKQQAEFIRLLLKSIDEFGFLAVAKHGVDLKLLDKCYDLSREFFEKSPLEDKMALSYDQIDQKKYSNVGYFRFKSETAVASKEADLKEFFHVGPTLPPDSPMNEYYATNVWPTSPVDLKASFMGLHQQCTVCGNHLIDAIAAAYELDRSYMQDLVHEGNSILRTIHYPPVEGDEVAMRAAPHTGIQLLGLQPRTTHPGLQMFLPSGEWVAPVGFDDYLLINIGDMLAYLLNHQIKATLHRVVNAQSGSNNHHRYAIVYFYHANSEKVLHQQGQSSSDQPLYAGEWLKQRLRELKLF